MPKVIVTIDAKELGDILRDYIKTQTGRDVRNLRFIRDSDLSPLTLDSYFIEADCGPP